MKINALGIELIKSFEGCRLTSYRCPAGVLTIGYGHTKSVYPLQKITQEQADELLLQDLATFEAGVQHYVKSKINENQFSALVSFSYNLGLWNLQKSTLLKKVNLNPNDKQIELEFYKWNRAGGRVLSGLTRRRKAEAKLYFT